MKKNYKKFLAGLLLLTVVNATAQLSGIVTINSGAATAGTNYQSFNAFKTALTTAGISGPLTVNVITNSGPYNEQVDFPAITGASAINTITVNGNGCLLSFNSVSSAAPWTLGLNGADYFTFNNLKIEGLGNTYALTCHLWNIADYNAFNTCTITAPGSGNATTQVPFSISGSATNPVSAGNAGNYNTLTGCVTVGGYYNIVFYTMTATPFNTGNNVYNCTLRDFFAYGFYNYYHRGFTFKGNKIERPNQGVTTTCAGIYLSTQSYSATIEGNIIHKLFENVPGTTGTCYGMYLAASATGSINLIQNNIISVTKMNGTIYGIYLPTGNYYNVYHNTISIGDNFSGGSGTIRGIYSTGGTSTTIRNNIVSVTHPGTGTKHCLYYTIGTIVSNNNDLWMNSGGTANHIGYFSANQTTLINWQAANTSAFDQQSWNSDPLFGAPLLSNFIPNSGVINNMGANLGTPVDYNGSARNTTPDPGALEFNNSNCGGSPAGGSVIVPTSSVCAGTVLALGFSTSYSVSGMTYQWQISTNSALGPFTAVPGATSQYIITPPITSSMWYSAIATCVGGSSVLISSGQVSVVTTVTNSVPYFEGFETISGVNKLPNCSWSASNLPAETQTNQSYLSYNRYPRTGNNYASFYYSPAGNKYFYSNGIQLYAGVTYSGSVWAVVGTQTGYYSSTPDWGQVSLLIGQNQSPTGQTAIANSGLTFNSSTYSQISNTFQVASSGIYYASVRANGTPGSGYNIYLSWDDLEITAPCAFNTFSMSLSSSTTTICSGETVNLVASGAGSYLWNTGETTAAITVTPNTSLTYNVGGTNTLTGCSAPMVSQLIIVNPTPIVSIIASPAAVCPGKPVTMTAVGNSAFYSWSNGSSANINAVTPQTTTSYSLIGTSNDGCIANAAVTVTVYTPPTITAIYPSEVCEGEKVTLTGNGAVSYEWSSNSVFVNSNPAIIQAGPSGTMQLTGTDAHGCTTTIPVNLIVNQCVGLTDFGSLDNTIRVYPNPANSEFTIELSKGSIQTVELVDISGRVIMKTSSGLIKTSLNIDGLSNGVYYAKIQTNENVIEIVKVIKQ